MGQQYRSRAVENNPNNAEGAVTKTSEGHQPQHMFSSPPDDLVGLHDISDQLASSDGVSDRDVKTPNHALPMPLA